jgi:superfamily I DNA and/or RNA helicase
MIKKKFVVAGNLTEYYAFLDKHKDDINVIYLYVNSTRDLKGIKDIEGYYTGTYNKRPDIETIKEVIRISKNNTYNEYTAEPVRSLDNSHVIDYRWKALETTANDYQQLSDNSMIDTMRNKDRD